MPSALASRPLETGRTASSQREFSPNSEPTGTTKPRNGWNLQAPVHWHRRTAGRIQAEGTAQSCPSSLSPHRFAGRVLLRHPADEEGGVALRTGIGQIVAKVLNLLLKPALNAIG